MLLSFFISSFLWAQSLPWQDGDFGCFDLPTAKRYVTDFNIEINSFGGMELCNSKVDTKKLFNDLAIIEKGQFQQARGNVFIRGFVPADGYYAWMKSQTRGMNRGNDLPTATAYNSGGFFTMQDGWSFSSTLGRVGTVIHEARHTAGYRHVRCSQGPYQDSFVSGCDTTYEYGGSHAIEMEYYARVAVQGLNFHPVYKSMARLMAVARSNFTFNKPVLQKREGLLALSATQGRADLIFDKKIFPRQVPLMRGYLKRTSFGGAIFDGQRAFSIELYGSQPLNTPIPDTYSYYKLLLESPQPAFDFEEFDVGSKRYVAVMRDPKTVQLFNFPKGVWDRPIRAPSSITRTATRLENEQSGYFLIDASGTIYPVDFQKNAIGSALPFKWNANTLSVVVLNQKLYVLRNDGIIYERTASQASRPLSQNRDRYRGLINTPVYDGFEVEP